MPSPPLSGIRVLSLAEQYPGPYATMLLADLGADVILVERPGSGDPSRRFPGLFASLNRNKRSIVLNLKNPEDKNVFLQLVDTADVVIEGFRPGVMQRLNLDAAALRQRKPTLIYTSISSFGQHGPLSGVAGHDLSIQAAAGMIKVPIGQESRSAVPVLPMADICIGHVRSVRDRHSPVFALTKQGRQHAGCLDAGRFGQLDDAFSGAACQPVAGARFAPIGSWLRDFSDTRCASNYIEHCRGGSDVGFPVPNAGFGAIRTSE